jgi:serine/threonine protein kinase
MIGQGKFGVIYLGKNNKTNENVAIKVEYNGSHAILKHEAKMLKYLNEKGETNIPLVYWFGPYNDAVVLVMSCYEFSLYDVVLNSAKYSILDLDSICIQTLKIIEYIHDKYVVHRDLKPQNIMMKKGSVYLIDFGMSTFYINELGEHVINQTIKSINTNKTILGSPKYISWNIHNGDTPSRRDDLISIGYIYILLNKGELPWTSSIMDGYKDHDTDTTNEINEKYKSVKSYENLVLSLGGNSRIYMEHCYKLSYNETPNYEDLCRIFM